MIIPEWHDIVLLVITGISLCAAFYTIALIIWVTPKSMSEYRWFLLQYTIYDAIFTFLFGVVMCPKMLFPGTGVIIQGLGRDIFLIVKEKYGDDGGDIIKRLCFMVITWYITNIISSQDYCLIYRFTVVHANQRYHDLLVNKKFVAATLIFAFILCIVFSVPCFLFPMPSEKDIPYSLKEYEKRFPGIFYDVTTDDVVIWLEVEISKMHMIFGLIFFGFIVSELVAVSSVFVILKILRQNASSFSAHTYKLHRQLTVLLIIQIANPFIFIISPILACIFAIVFDLKFQRKAGIYGILFMSCYTISNTILTIGFVSPYRNFTKKYILGMILKLPFLKKYQTVAPTIVIPSTSGTSFNPQLARHQ